MLQGGTQDPGNNVGGGSPEANNASEGNQGMTNNQVQTQAGQDPGWLGGLKAETRERYGDQLRGHQVIDDFVNHAVERMDLATQLEGRLENAIPRPGANATAEEIAAFRKALGVPESADQYQFERAELPDGLPHNEALQGWFGSQAFELGLSQGQAGELFKRFNSRAAEQYRAAREAEEREVQQIDTTLKNELGDQYEPMVGKAQHLLKKYCGEEFLQFLDQANLPNGKKLANDPRLIKGMIGIAKQFDESEFVEGTVTAQQQSGTPGEYSFPNTKGME